MSNMRYLESDGMWLLPSPEDFDCEVLVAGDKACPHPERLELIRSAVALLGELRTRGVSYLESFVDRTKLAPGHNWTLVGVEAGRREDRQDRFTLHYSIEHDIYGDWFVTFQRSGDNDYPVAFGRRQT
jgi:hypothetical protein